MNSGNDVPGYGYQLSKGATSLTESWAGLRDVSNNHMMLGHLMEWFFSGVGGIRQGDSKAYKHILISPEVVGDIHWAETSFQSVHGVISSSWQINDKNFILTVRIPVNCTATVELPRNEPEKISVNGTPLKSSGFVESYEVAGVKTLCVVLPGEYTFEISL